MDLTASLLSRLQFVVTVSFHIIFPAFTIGLAAWLAFLFWGTGIVVLPITLAYTGVAYFVFRGKVLPSS
jgi:cytochrome bd-type quinol oxidase subunit 1